MPLPQNTKISDLDLKGRVVAKKKKKEEEGCEGTELTSQPAAIYRKSEAGGERNGGEIYTFNPTFTPRFSPFHSKANNSSLRVRESKQIQGGLGEQLWGKRE